MPHSVVVVVAAAAAMVVKLVRQTVSSGSTATTFNFQQ